MKTTQVCIKWRKQDGSYRKYRAKEVLSYFSSCFTLFTLLSYFFWNLHLNSATLIFLSVESIIPVSFLQKSQLVLSKVFSFSFPAFSTYTKYLVRYTHFADMLKNSEVNNYQACRELLTPNSILKCFCS